MEANPERELADMNLKMDDLKSALDDIDDFVKRSITDAMRGVLDEWACTQDCITDMQAEIEALEDD